MRSAREDQGWEPKKDAKPTTKPNVVTDKEARRPPQPARDQTPDQSQADKGGSGHLGR